MEEYLINNLPKDIVYIVSEYLEGDIVNGLDYMDANILYVDDRNIYSKYDSNAYVYIYLKNDFKRVICVKLEQYYFGKIMINDQLIYGIKNCTKLVSISILTNKIINQINFGENKIVGSY